MPLILVMFHGWGLDSHSWKNITNSLEKNVYKIKIMDYGYFGEKNICNIPKEPWIGITHSIGFAKMIHITNLQNCIGIVNISGFKKFNIKNKIIKRMIFAFKQNPIETLNKFYIKSGLNIKNIILMREKFLKLNYQLLLEDLQYISKLNINYDINIPIFSVYTEDDMIISKKTIDQTQLLKNNFIFLSNGDHMSIIKLSNFYSSLIKNFIWQILFK